MHTRAVLIAAISFSTLPSGRLAAQAALFKPALFCSKPTAALPPRAALSPVFLPKWSAESLPFFCRIEHSWAKKNGGVPLKFRLGSVDYVDWLEGKAKWYKG